MAATIGVYSAPGHTETQLDPVANARRHRRISAQAGRALEILSHAIEYLTDEYVHRATEVSAHDSQVEAIQLLMAINREIYFECPVAPTLGQRLRDLFEIRAHS